MRKKNALEQIQWDFKQISYFTLRVGTVYKFKAFKKTVLELRVSLSISPIDWSLQSNVTADKGTADRDSMLSNQ